MSHSRRDWGEDIAVVGFVDARRVGYLRPGPGAFKISDEGIIGGTPQQKSLERKKGVWRTERGIRLYIKNPSFQFRAWILSSRYWTCHQIEYHFVIFLHDLCLAVEKVTRKFQKENNNNARAILDLVR